GGAALGGCAGCGLGDDRGRAPALGRLPRHAHFGGGDRGKRDSRRLRHPRGRLPRARRRGRLGPASPLQDAGLMHLYDLPLWFALVGLVLYTVLGGADFGAGFWQLVAGKGKRADELRDEAHHAMAPVWEANHVWLIFVLTVVWTAYPAAFGSIASTLSIPLFIAAIGI